MSGMSFQEKSTLGTLIGTLGFGLMYFYSAWHLWQNDRLIAPAMFGLLMGCTIMLVIALVVYHILIAVLSKPEDEDERDRLVGWRAGNIGGLILGLAVMTIILHVAIGGLYGDPLALSPVLIANALLVAMVISTAAELGLKLYYYRRGV